MLSKKRIAASIAALALLAIGGTVTAQADPSNPYGPGPGPVLPMPCGSMASPGCPLPAPPPGGYQAPSRMDTGPYGTCQEGGACWGPRHCGTGEPFGAPC